jgi:hypothetical protein
MPYLPLVAASDILSARQGRQEKTQEAQALLDRQAAYLEKSLGPTVGPQVGAAIRAGVGDQFAGQVMKQAQAQDPAQQAYHQQVTAAVLRMGGVPYKEEDLPYLATMPADKLLNFASARNREAGLEQYRGQETALRERGQALTERGLGLREQELGLRRETEGNRYAVALQRLQGKGGGGEEKLNPAFKQWQSAMQRQYNNYLTQRASSAGIDTTPILSFDQWMNSPAGTAAQTALGFSSVPPMYSGGQQPKAAPARKPMTKEEKAAVASKAWEYIHTYKDHEAEYRQLYKNQTGEDLPAEVK